MPGFDRTGPQGMGPMTGGKRGYCRVNAGQEVMYGCFGGGRMNRRGHRGNFAPGRMRGGFGRRGQYPFQMNDAMQASPVYINKADELNFLRNEALDLKETLKNIESRITDLETEDQPSS